MSSNVQAEQRASDAMSEALGTPHRTVLSDQEAVDQISVVLADQQQEQQHAEAQREAELSGVPLQQQEADEQPLPQLRPHPLREPLRQALGAAAEMAQRANAMRAQAQALRQSHRNAEAAVLLTDATALDRESNAIIAKVQEGAGIVLQQEGQARFAVAKEALLREDRKVQRELGSAWNADAKRQLAELALEQGYKPHELAQFDSRAVLALAKLAGITNPRKPAPDSVKARLRPGHPATQLEAQFANRHVRPGSLEAAAAQIASGKRISQDRQAQLWNKRVSQPASQPGRPASQQSEQAIMARLAKVM